MSDTSPMDGYMYFVGEGKFGPEKTSIGKVRGETLDTRFSTHGAFKIWTFNWQSAHDTSSASTSGGDDDDPGDELKKKRRKLISMSANRKDAMVSVGAITITKDVDAATPSLFIAHARCAVFDGAHIYYRKTGGGKLFTFFHAAFSEVIIEKWECGFDANAKETITVNFNWCQINYFPQSSKGVMKKDAANIKQYCTSDPESDKVPRVLTSTTVADMNIVDN